jgi:hypothetical protein
MKGDRPIRRLAAPVIEPATQRGDHGVRLRGAGSKAVEASAKGGAVTVGLAAHLSLRSLSGRIAAA